MALETGRLPIQYSCYFVRSRAGEQYVPEHAMGFVLSGSIEVSDGVTSNVFREGDVYFCRRARLGKYTKLPAAEGGFRSISIRLDQEMLRSFSMAHSYETDGFLQTDSFIRLPAHSLLAKFMASLKDYETIFSQEGAKELVAVKQQEALLLLLQAKPELKNVLFDFSAPGKMDLEGFMNRNYHFNVALERFAYLTGRSLSTFKRDFEKIFGETPSRWLLQKRLQEARYLMAEKGKTASDIYLDLGFEDLSHFSFAFRKAYGVAPSGVYSKQ